MSKQKISITTEMMANYKQSAVMSPDKKFEALQTASGFSLLFSIGSDNIFYVTTENPGKDTGWDKTDLSSAQIKNAFGNKTGLFCKTFEAAQNSENGTIGLAMVISDGNSDFLFLCLGNSDTDTSWLENPQWTNCPFDNPDQPLKVIKIADVMISETAKNKQCIVVDTLRDAAQPNGLVYRFYIDTQMEDGYMWHAHDLAIDLQADQYTSCIGRQKFSGSRQPTIDGIYTSGKINGSAQLIFQPLFDVFNPAMPAAPSRLSLPGNLVADTIAASRNPDLSSDLYACSGGGLYYFASLNQNDGATAVLLSKNAMFNSVRKMFAYQSGKRVVVWGLNGNNEVFYTSCEAGKELTSGAWSYPMPLVSKVDMFSPYINRRDNANTFFAVSDRILQKLTKSATDGIWDTQFILLPTTDNNSVQQFTSYTTQIKVTDAENRPVPKAKVSISADMTADVFINHLYYVIDTNGIEVETDELGTITVVERIDGLAGTILTVTGGDGVVNVLNPMDSPFNKIAALDTVDKLKNAKITNDDGSTKPLIPSGISNDDLKAVAEANSQLALAYESFNSGSLTSLARKGITVNKQTALAPDLLSGAILADIGDMFRWLKTGVKAVIEIIKDAITGLWNFVVKIAGVVYKCVLNTIQAIIEAVVWIFNMIKTVIEELIKFLAFLFNWGDIVTTHRVMKNVFIQFAQHNIDSLSGYKPDISAIFLKMKQDVNKWADIPTITQTPNETMAAADSLPAQDTPPANLGVSLYQSGASGAEADYTPETAKKSTFDYLMEILKKEGKVLISAYEQIKTQIIEPFGSLTITEIIKRFVAIVTDALLDTAEVIIQAIIDVFIQLANDMIEMLTKTINIPVISWLYKKIAGEDLSVLDLVCLISAIPATIVYKAVAGVTPFPKEEAFTVALLNAKSYSDLENVFYTQPAAGNRTLDEGRLKLLSFISSLFAETASLIKIVVDALQRGIDMIPDFLSFLKNPFAKALAITAAVNNIAYLAPNISMLINNQGHKWYRDMNNVLAGIGSVKGFVDIDLATEDEGVRTIISPAIDSLLGLVWFIPPVMNIVDNHSGWNSNYKSLIPESVGNFSFSLAGTMEFPISLLKDPVVKWSTIGVQYIFMLSYGLCMPVAGGIYGFSDGQQHD